ncbi:MAG TPA: hypothetical protein DCL38_04150 [Lachnospiraceae bacterium]|nr:hypothetical protein [Lachnospiraceae bacterium]
MPVQKQEKHHENEVSLQEQAVNGQPAYNQSARARGMQDMASTGEAAQGDRARNNRTPNKRYRREKAQFPGADPQSYQNYQGDPQSYQGFQGYQGQVADPQGYQNYQGFQAQGPEPQGYRNIPGAENAAPDPAKAPCPSVSVNTRQPHRSASTFYGIASFLFSVVAFFGGYKVLTLSLALAAVVLGIIALVKNCRLKAFPIISFVIAGIDILFATIVLIGGALSSNTAANTVPLKVSRAGIDFSLPASFTEAKSNDTYTIYSSSKDGSAIVFCEMDGGLPDETFIIGASQFDQSINDMVGQMMSSYEAAGSANTRVCNMPCRETIYSGTLGEEAGYAAVSLINNQDAGRMVLVMTVCTEAQKQSALNNYQSMLANAVRTPAQ